MAEAQPQSVMECPICYLAFDGIQCKPTVGSCGHGICINCFYQVRGTCPMCQGNGMFQFLVINYSLIEQIELTNTNMARSRTAIGQREEEIDILKVEISEKNENLETLQAENQRLAQQHGPCACNGEANKNLENEVKDLRIQLTAAEFANIALNENLAAVQAANQTQFEIFNSNCTAFHIKNTELENTNSTMAEELRNLKANMDGHEQRWKQEQEVAQAPLMKQLQVLKTKLEKMETEATEKDEKDKVEMEQLKSDLKAANRSLEEKSSQAKSASAFLKKRTEEREQYRKEKEEIKEKLEETTWKMERMASELENCKQQRDRLTENLERVEAEMEQLRRGMESISTESVPSSPGIPFFTVKLETISENEEEEISGNKRRVPRLLLQRLSKKRKEADCEVSKEKGISKDICKSPTKDVISETGNDVDSEAA